MRSGLSYLSDLNKRTFLIVELGLQTIHDKTAKLLNRCSSYANFEETVKRLRAHHIMVVVHIINGLPYESEEMMIETAKKLNQLDIQGIKIHMLQILKDTALEKWYQKEKFSLLSLEEYVNITVETVGILTKRNCHPSYYWGSRKRRTGRTRVGFKEILGHE